MFRHFHSALLCAFVGLALACVAPATAHAIDVGECYVGTTVEADWLPEGRLPSAFAPGIRAITARNVALAENFASSLIQNPPRSESLLYDRWVLSEAFIFRAAVYKADGRPESQWFGDVLHAADLGNRDAISAVLSIVLEPTHALPASAEFERLVRTGATLGIDDAQCVMSTPNPPFAVSADERNYWSLLSFETYETLLQQINSSGPNVAAGLMRRLSLVGGPLPAQGAIPGRSVANSVVVERFLRGAAAHEMEWPIPPAGTPAPQESVRDVINSFRQALPTNASLRFVTFTQALGPAPDPDSFALPREQIAALISPGDNVFVRCGALSHTAIVYAVDRAAGTIQFVDPFYNYWFPTHNSCITQFAPVARGNSVVVSQVRLSELTPMLQALVSARDADASRAQPIDRTQMFPDSSRVELTINELAPLARLELRIARNEIYARHGYIFQSPDLRNHFSRLAWYHPASPSVTLNPVEDYNVRLIQRIENLR